MIKKLSTYHYRKSMNGRRNWKDRNIISKLIQDNNKQLLVLEVANVQHEVRSVVKEFFWLTVISYLPREKHLLNFRVIAAIGLVIQHPSLCRYMLRWRTSSQSLTHEKNMKNYFFIIYRCQIMRIFCIILIMHWYLCIKLTSAKEFTTGGCKQSWQHFQSNVRRTRPGGTPSCCVFNWSCLRFNYKIIHE